MIRSFTRCALLAGALLGLSPLAQAQTLYENFETVRLLTYPYSDGTFVQNAPNPASSPVNSSPTVGMYTRNAGAQYDVIVINPVSAPKFADVADYLSGAKQVTIKFRSPAVGTAVQLVMQDNSKSGTGYPNGNLGGTFDATTTVANAWEVLSFTFNAGTSDPSVTSTDVNQFVMLIAPGTGDGSTYYFDDMTGPDFVAPPAALLPQLYDNYENVHLLDYRLNLTSGGFRADTINPFMTAGNNSAKVARYSRSTSQYDALVARPLYPVLDAGSYLGATAANHMTLKVYSPGPGHLFQITLQDSTVANGGNYPGGRHSEHQATTTGTGWETLTFNNTGRPDPTIGNLAVNEFVLLIDPNTFARQRYYLDDWFGPKMDSPTGLKADKELAASVRAFPNPASDQAAISLTLPRAATVGVQLFDLQGRLVATPQAAASRPAGEQTVRFSTANLSAGLYQYRVTVDGATVSGKLSVVR